MDPEKIKAATLKLARKHGLINLSRRALCDELHIPEGSFSHYAGCTFREHLQKIFAKGLAKIEAGHAVARARAAPEFRREHMLSAAVELAREQGYQTVTREAIAERAKVSTSLVTYVLGNVDEIKQLIMITAVRRGIVEIVAQGIFVKDPIAAHASDTVRSEAAAMLMRRGE